jgi:hypothetical protein
MLHASSWLLNEAKSFFQPRTCNYGNQCAAQFPEGIITNYKERKIISPDKMKCPKARKIISPDKMKCSNTVSRHSPADYGTSKKPVCDNQETETYVHWHLSSYLVFMTDKRMTFDEFITEPGILYLQPKKPVSTMNDQCGRSDNMMCKINQTISNINSSPILKQ